MLEIDLMLTGPVLKLGGAAVENNENSSCTCSVVGRNLLIGYDIWSVNALYDINGRVTS